MATLVNTKLVFFKFFWIFFKFKGNKTQFPFRNFSKTNTKILRNDENVCLKQFFFVLHQQKTLRYIALIARLKN
jgi:hypothetical protein